MRWRHSQAGVIIYGPKDCAAKSAGILRVVYRCPLSSTFHSRPTVNVAHRTLIKYHSTADTVSIWQENMGNKKKIRTSLSLSSFLSLSNLNSRRRNFVRTHDTCHDATSINGNVCANHSYPEVIRRSFAVLTLTLTKAYKNPITSLNELHFKF